MTDRHAGLPPGASNTGRRKKNEPEDPQQDSSLDDRLHNKGTGFEYDITRRGFDDHGIRTQSPGANSDENWTKISDLAERRRISNRNAQRNYREKLRRRLDDLERRASSSSPPPFEKQQDQIAQNGPISIFQRVEKPPDHPRGYPRLSAYLSTNESFMVYHRFAALHAQLLQKQTELYHQLEEQLDLTGRLNNDTDNQFLDLRQESDQNTGRQILLSRIKRNLDQYDHSLLDWTKIEGVELGLPNRRDWGNKTIREFLRDEVLLKTKESLHSTNYRLDDNFWTRYEKDVNDLLMDPESDKWLNSKISDVLGPVQSSLERDEGPVTRRQSLMNGRDQVPLNRLVKVLTATKKQPWRVPSDV